MFVVLEKCLQLLTEVSKPGHKARSPRRAPFKPALHILEDRTVLSTFTVSSTSDSIADPGSLRYAVTHADDGDLIGFSPSLASQSIYLTSGNLEINKDLTIHGPVGGQEIFGGAIGG